MARIKVLCKGCNTLLLRYDKRGRGALVKINPKRVIEDFTIATEPFKCPQCLNIFARPLAIAGISFRKLLGGKVSVAGGGITAR